MLAPDRRSLHALPVTPSRSQLGSYRTTARGAGQPRAASTQTSRLAFRRHSFVLRCRFGCPIVCSAGRGSSDGHAWRRDPAPGPTRPHRRAWLGASGTPLATAQADRCPSRRFGGRPPDRWNAPPPVTCADDVVRLSCAARAIALKSAFMSIGRRNSRPSGLHGPRLDCRRGRHRPPPVERNHEQARMVEQINRSAC